MGALFHLLDEAVRSQEYYDLAGIGPEDGCYPPLYDLKKALQRALSEVRQMERHEHVWNESDYCDICGNDGRA